MLFGETIGNHMKPWDEIEDDIKEHDTEHWDRFKFTAAQLGHAWENLFVEWWRSKNLPNPQRYGEILMILTTIILMVAMPVLGPIALVVGFATGGFNE